MDLRPIQTEDAATLHAHDYDLDGVTLHGISMGSGPLVVLLHGISSNAYIYMPMMKALAKRFRVLSVDMRGHGRSSKPASGYSADHYAADLEKLISGLGGQAVVVGHALGAKAAFHLAATAPHLVSAVVSIEFVPFIEAEVFDHLDDRVMRGHHTFDSIPELHDALARRYIRMPDEAVARRVQYGFSKDGNVLAPLSSRSALRQSIDDLKLPIDAVFNSLSVPTLLIRGTQSVFVSAEAWRQAKAARPDFAAVEIADVDHYAAEEAPEEIAAEIIRFYDALATS